MPPVGPVSTPVVIGRHQELATLDALLNGGSGVLLISGEAGIGKSRLAREAVAQPRFVAIAFSRAPASTATSRSPTRRCLT